MHTSICLPKKLQESGQSLESINQTSSRKGQSQSAHLLKHRETKAEGGDPQTPSSREAPKRTSALVAKLPHQTPALAPQRGGLDPPLPAPCPPHPFSSPTSRHSSGTGNDKIKPPPHHPSPQGQKSSLRTRVFSCSFDRPWTPV